MKRIVVSLGVVITLTSCVSKKKFIALQDDFNQTQSSLSKTLLEKEALESKYQRIEARVEDFNTKVNSLKSANASLTKESQNKLSMLKGSKAPISVVNLEQINQQIAAMDPNEVAQAKTLNDSINLVLNKNLVSGLESTEGINIEVDETVVMINVSDDLLFNTGSYRVSSKAYGLLQQLSDVINSEPSVNVMIEGHTDSRSIKTDILEDNWDLSVKRATSIVRLLQNKYNVKPEQLIASGRSSYDPLVENSSRENRALNRRTRIVIMPDLDKFLSMIVSK